MKYFNYLFFFCQINNLFQIFIAESVDDIVAIRQAHTACMRTNESTSTLCQNISIISVNWKYEVF